MGGRVSHDHYDDGGHDCAQCRAFFELNPNTTPLKHLEGGLWNDPSVPHRGWTCVEVIDNEEQTFLCRMCAKMRVRYIHCMEHPNFPEIIKVGCICAGYMEGDLEAAEKRDRKLKAEAKKKKEAAKKEAEAKAAEAARLAAIQAAKDEVARRNREYLAEFEAKQAAKRAAEEAEREEGRRKRQEFLAIKFADVDKASAELWASLEAEGLVMS